MESPTFAQRLVRMRESRGLTLQQLATKAKTTYQTLWRIEHKDSEPGVFLAARLARALDCSLDYLCGLYSDERDGRPAGIADAWKRAMPEGGAHPEMAPASL